MHFEIARKDLINPLKTAVGVVEQRQTLPILGNVLTKVEGGNLYLTATDAEVEIACSTVLEEPNLDDSDNGAVTIPARKLFDICRSLPANAQIKLTTEEGEEKITVTSGRSRFSLATLPAEDFPETPEIDSIFSFKMPQSILKYMLMKTQFAMAQQDARYYLNGILMDLIDDTISIVATDGHRLGLATNELEMNGEEQIQAIIPRKAVIELTKMLADNDDEVSISLDSNHIRIIMPDKTIMSSKLIDGRFPDYRAVIPVALDKIVTAKCEPLKQALTRVSILSNEKFKGVRLSLSKDVLKLNAKNAFQEESEEITEVDYQGEELEIGFNSLYLLDVLNTVDTDSVELHFSDENSSCLMNPKDSDSLKYVVMPMRL